MTNSIKRSEKKDAKLMLKILIGFLPLVGLLFGLGVGLSMSWFEYATSVDLYVRLFSILLPAVSIVIAMQYYYFKKIDSWFNE